MFQQDASLAEIPFGGKFFIAAGDWRQGLPVVPRGGRAQIMVPARCMNVVGNIGFFLSFNALAKFPGRCLKASYLWPMFTTYHLTDNMRIAKLVAEGKDPTLQANFEQWLLSVGDGQRGTLEPIPTCVLRIN